MASSRSDVRADFRIESVSDRLVRTKKMNLGDFYA